jgi:hypothetical protein
MHKTGFSMHLVCIAPVALNESTLFLCPIKQDLLTYFASICQGLDLNFQHSHPFVPKMRELMLFRGFH